MAAESGCSVLFNAIVVNDRFPEVHQAQLKRIVEHNAAAKVENFKELMESPYVLPGVSDGGAHVKFITPSIYPTEVLAWMSRDAGQAAAQRPSPLNRSEKISVNSDPLSKAGVCARLD